MAIGLRQQNSSSSIGLVYALTGAVSLVLAAGLGVPAVFVTFSARLRHVRLPGGCGV